jgi:hypothetical protein
MANGSSTHAFQKSLTVLGTVRCTIKRNGSQLHHHTLFRSEQRNILLDSGRTSYEEPVLLTLVEETHTHAQVEASSIPQGCRKQVHFQKLLRKVLAQNGKS